MERIILVEENNDYREFLDNILTREGYEVVVAENAIRGLEILAVERFDLIMTDLHLEVVDGIRLIGTAREIDPGIMTIVLTEKPATVEELAQLKVSVDFYVEKNRSIDIILAYVKILLDKKRKTSPEKALLFSVEEDLKVDVKSHTVVKEGQTIDLTPKEFEVLRCFLANKNNVISREDMINEVWIDEVVADDSRVVDVHVQKLREKLKSYSILTVRGKGYKWHE